MDAICDEHAVRGLVALGCAEQCVATVLPDAPAVSRPKSRFLPVWEESGSWRKSRVCAKTRKLFRNYFWRGALAHPGRQPADRKGRERPITIESSFNGERVPRLRPAGCRTP